MLPRSGPTRIVVPGPDGELLGAVVSMHIFNNDFTLVDRIKEVAPEMLTG